jgi:hypothetical protein
MSLMPHRSALAGITLVALAFPVSAQEFAFTQTCALAAASL